MRDVVFLLLGAVLGVIATESYSKVKARYAASRSARELTSSASRDDPRRHAKHVVDFFSSRGLDSQLYTPASTHSHCPLPVLPDTSDRFVGRLQHESDWPLAVSRAPRFELPVDHQVIAAAKRRGVELWDGTILYASGWDALAKRLNVERCNYFSYVSFGESVLRESDSDRGKKPYLEATDYLDRALNSGRGPTVIAAATTCVFESARGRLTAVHQRSSRVVNARGMYAVTPVHGIEPNFSGTETSRYGVVVYNVLKEILEEFFGLDEVKYNNDQPRAAHPDWVFATNEGKALITELQSGRLQLHCDGACIDLTDGGLVLAVTAHFLDERFIERLKLEARGGEEASWVDGRRFEFFRLSDPRLELLMDVNQMISSSVFSLDRARLRFAPSS